MKQQYTPRYILLIACALLLTISCKKDFLEIAPQGSLTDAFFPNSANDALLAVNAVYGSLHNWNYHSGGFPILDILSDDSHKGSNPGDAARLVLFDNYQFTATASDIYPWYSAMYLAVKAANVVIEKVPAINMNEGLKSRYIAEARFLRAMFYFNLVRTFGDVPKVTTVITERKLARSPKQEIYDEIILPDLIHAAQTLPDKTGYGTDEEGRATNFAAKALLAKVYLYLGNYTLAEQYALEVINSTQYDLMPDFADAFSVNGQYGQESIFEIGARPFETSAQGGNQFANTQGVRGVPNKGWGFNRPSINLINAFEAGDLRKDATVVFLGETIDGVYIQGDLSTQDTIYTDATNTAIKEIETYNQKVWTPGSTTVEQWGYNIRVLRYAEVLLIAAEASFRNGNIAQALDFTNQLRQRAGLSLLTSITLNDIFKERRAEMAMEGDRFYDLVRTGQAAEVLGPLGFQTNKHELFPLPQSEIDLSEGTLSQNPNW